MDPIGGAWLSVIVGFVRGGQHVVRGGFIPAFIYATSFLIFNTEREVSPTTPVYLWSIWFFYTFGQLWQGNKKWLYSAAILISLIWHLIWLWF